MAVEATLLLLFLPEARCHSAFDSSFLTGFCYTAQAGLELMILVPQFLGC